MIPEGLISEYNETRETTKTQILCHAPFSNLNFEQNGNVTACCYNRAYILGKYPKDTIKDIWFGRKTDKFRAYIRQNDLSRGCTMCLEQLRSKNFYGTRARHFDCYAEESTPIRSKRFFPPFFRTEMHIRMPRVMEFELSNVCNLECIMCDGYSSSTIRGKREQLLPLPNPYDDRFVEQLEEFIPHLTDAKFLGGEPFLIDIYYKIWEKIKILKPEITVHITTNGSVLPLKAKRLLEELKCGIVLSIDSIRKGNYEQIRLNADFEKVMNNFQYFLDYTRRKNTWMSLAVCTLTKNWYEIPDIVSFCNENEISICFNTVILPGRYSLRFLPKFILERIIEYYRNLKLPSDTPLKKRNLQCFLDLTNQLVGWLNEISVQEGLLCHLEEKIEKVLIAATSEILADGLHHETIVEEIVKSLSNYSSYTRKGTNMELIGNHSNNIKSTINTLIETRDSILLPLTRIINDNGYDYFFEMYFKALCTLNTLLNRGQEDKHFTNKTTALFDAVRPHRRKTMIIDGISWYDPLFIVNTINQMSVKQIQEYFANF